MLEDNKLEVSASTKQTRISPPLDTQDIYGSGVAQLVLLQLKPMFFKEW